jgi:NADPH-dependent curcumin reductase CurA
MLRAMPQRTREIHLAARPVGEPKPSDFRLVQADLADPGPGELLVRNMWMSVDPYMRGRMNAGRSYAAPYELDAPLYGGAVGEVAASGDERFAPGDVVLHQAGWREHAVLPASSVSPVDTGRAPVQYALGALGMPGLTAYTGLHLAGLREGDVVFVSGAAGAVGSMAAQLAKLRGHTVIGSAGSPAKVAYLLDELRLDAAFDYHDGPVAKLLGRAAPDGIDLYFDNVGGEHLEAAIRSMRDHGRVAMCGWISGYNATEPPPGPRNLGLIVGKRLMLRGFIVSDHEELRHDFVREAATAVADGRIVVHETVRDGLEQAPQALIDLLRGENLGKMLVRLA